MLLSLELLLLLKNWPDPGVGQPSNPLAATTSVDGITVSNISTSPLVTAAMGFPKIVMVICLVLGMMQVDIGENGVERGVYVSGSLSNNSSTLCLRRQLIPIQYQNTFLSSFSESDEMMQ